MDYYIIYIAYGVPSVIKFETWMEMDKWKNNFLLSHQCNTECYVDFIFYGDCKYSSAEIIELESTSEEKSTV